MTTAIQQVRVPCTSRFSRATLEGVAGPASPPAPDEPALARRAAAGDGEAFATLYERYEKRTYNLCYRILGSQDDAADAAQEAFVSVLRRLPKLEGRELAFGSYLFTSARNACYDLIARHKRTEPSDEIPEYATPVGGAVGGGGIGFDPGDPEDDPERNVLLDARTEEIRSANLSLPERQREVLALKELEDLSYDEIAEIMGMNRNSVAQLISRARINLRSALQGSALASFASTSPDCERALPLIAAQQDSQLPGDSADADWLGDHLMSCDACRLGREAMEEAGMSYRAWLPIGAGPLLFRETMAEASEVVGADWSEIIARHEAKRSKAPANGAGAGINGRPGGGRILPHRRLDLALMAVLILGLTLVAFVGPTTDAVPVTAVLPASDEEPAATGDDPEPDSGKPAKNKQNKQGSGNGGQPGGATPDDEPADDAASGGDQPASSPNDGGTQRRRSNQGEVDRNGGGGGGGGVGGGGEGGGGRRRRRRRRERRRRRRQRHSRRPARRDTVGPAGHDGPTRRPTRTRRRRGTRTRPPTTEPGPAAHAHRLPRRERAPDPLPAAPASAALYARGALPCPWRHNSPRPALGPAAGSTQ